MRTLRETYIDLIYMGSRKRQGLLSKVGAWRPWEKVEEEGRGKERSREKCKTQKKIKKKTNVIMQFFSQFLYVQCSTLCIHSLPCGWEIVLFTR